jgi:hypothetical protein
VSLFFRIGRLFGFLFAAISVGLATLVAAGTQTPVLSETQLATEDRVQSSGWWPTKGTPARVEYTGPTACARCHAEKAATQLTTPMAHSIVRAADSEILRRHDRVTFSVGHYLYQIVRSEGVSIYSVTDGLRSTSAPLAWAFGLGDVGQTYVFEQNGKFYESRLSYYTAIQGLDFSPGHLHSAPSHLDDALGRLMDAAETRLCFACHTTASTTGNRFDPDRLIPGVTCEACHGPGARHVSALTLDDTQHGTKLIFNPAGLSPSDSVDFCGACHRTFVDVGLAGTVGIRNVRFQPYRLETSRCWRKGDARITCLACHDPHAPLLHEPTGYDRACLRCHGSQANLKPAGDLIAPACPKNMSGCVTCHMPKLQIPGMHSQFTDHRIHIVRKGEPAYLE